MSGWVSLDEFALGERDVWGDPSGRRELAATLPAIRKDVGPSRSPSATSVGVGCRDEGRSSVSGSPPPTPEDVP